MTEERIQTALSQAEPPPEGDAQRAGTEPTGGGGAAGSADVERQLLELRLASAGLPAVLADAVRGQFQSGAVGWDGLEALIERSRQRWGEAVAQGAIRNLGASPALMEPLDRVELAFERLMGLPETAEHRAVPRLSGIREMYDLMTGDWERRGLFQPSRVALANATTVTMASVVANVLNKALLRAYEAREPWWRPIAYEEDFATLQDPRWISLGGFSDLDTVTEGNPYQEKTWSDAGETSAFVKKGNYLGLTLEMIDRDDVGAVRAIPRKLAYAAQRTLSSAVAALFTANSGVGPDLADDTPLFDDDHDNLGSSALDADAWWAVVTGMFEQPELHSNKRTGVRPRYCLVPLELEREALGIFASDYPPGAMTFEQNVLRNTATVITVPDWTDADDWAAAADPADLEGVCIGYRFGRAPEIFVADGDTMGAMFTNDEMRIKVRFVYAVGVGDYRALYKQNVSSG